MSSSPKTTVRVLESDTNWRLIDPRYPESNSLDFPRDGRWTLTGTPENPTFAPSMNETSGFPGDSLEDLRGGRVAARSHFFVRNGNVEYLADSTHELAGKTVPLPYYPESEITRLTAQHGYRIPGEAA